jgi:putative oxidoreductase
MDTMFLKLIATDDDNSALILRLALGIMIFAHGAQKLLGWFGGYGFGGTMGFFQSLGIPYVFGLLAIFAEFFGGLGMIVGLLTRVAAFGVACNMVVAMLLVHWQHGFFMDWGGDQAGEGVEFFLLAIAMAVALILRGAGRWSVDRALTVRQGEGT